MHLADTLLPRSILERHRARLHGARACVTGGAGFIGSHLVDALVASGVHVTVIDDFSNGREENLQGAGRSASVVRASVCEPSALEAAVSGCDFVFHQAAMGSVPRSLKMPLEYHESNVTGTLRVLEASRRAGVRRVVYAASSSAYGNTAVLPKVELMRPDPLSPYAYTKLAGEHLVRAWSSCFGVDGISLRYFNIFGPRQRHDSPYAAVIPLFARHLRAGTSPDVYGDGLQTRDFTFVANAVHANLLAAGAAGPLGGQMVNVACGTRFSLMQLLESMARIIGVDSRPTFHPPRVGDVRDSEASIEAAQRLIGYEVIVPFDEGLRATLAAQR